MEPIEDEFELIEKIQLSLGLSSDLLTPEGLEFSALQAVNELGYKFPISDPTKKIWALKRGKRHALDILRIQSAHRFRYKQLALNHRFNHYHALIQEMDKEFEDMLDDLALSSSLTMYIESGFVYDSFGNDITKYVHRYFKHE